MGRLRDFFWRSSFFPRKLSFTREGKVVVLVSIGLGMAAVNTGNNLLYMVFGLSLALIIISGILSEANLRRLECLALKTLRTTARRATHVVLTVKSHRRRFPAFTIEAWPLFDGLSSDVEPARFPELKPGETGIAACSITFHRRGEFELRGMVVSTTFPFSFFRKSVVTPVQASVIVHPAVHPVTGEETTVSQSGEDEHRPVAGRGQEFFGVRDFRDGDSPRHILHRRSANRPSPVIREFEELGSKSVWIALVNAAVDGRGGGDRVEAAVESAASLAVHYLDSNEVVGLVTASGEVSAGSGPAQAVRILDFLANIPILMTDSKGLGEVTAGITVPEDAGRVVHVSPGHVVANREIPT